MQENINQNITTHLRDRFPKDFSKLLKDLEKKNISTLSTLITLVENKKYSYHPELMDFLSTLPPANKTLRVAITGAPGAGKSTLIETLGLHLIKEGFSVAVLAVDPASDKSRGSILGDKTRMEKLSISAKAYIRPSSNSLETGGVRSSTFQTIRLCEASGFDFVLVETVGVGQSEFAVSKLTDIMLLLLTPTGGDELQGIKKGIVELADLILVNKADGAQIETAEKSKREYAKGIHYSKQENRILDDTEVKTISALENKGVDEISKTLVHVLNNPAIRLKINDKRNKQKQFIFKKAAQDMLAFYISENTKIKKRVNSLSVQVDYFKGLKTLTTEFEKKIKLL